MDPKKLNIIRSLNALNVGLSENTYKLLPVLRL